MKFPHISLPRSVVIFIVGALLGSFATLKFAKDKTIRSTKLQGSVQGVASEQTAPAPIFIQSEPYVRSLVSEMVTVRPVRVVDGDTLELAQGLKVRLIGIDTPEIGASGREGCLAQAARAAHARLVEGKEVRLERDVSDRDRYQRALRYVWVVDAMVNKVLVEQGLAQATIYPPDVKYENTLRAAEAQARALKLGRWGDLCRGVGEERDSVGIKRTTPALAWLPFNEACSIKGNLSGRGEKIYHVEGCASYDKTKIDIARGERWFCTEQEAQSAGWRMAKNCP